MGITKQASTLSGPQFLYLCSLRLYNPDVLGLVVDSNEPLDFFLNSSEAFQGTGVGPPGVELALGSPLSQLCHVLSIHSPFVLVAAHR